MFRNILFAVASDSLMKAVAHFDIIDWCHLRHGARLQDMFVIVQLVEFGGTRRTPHRISDRSLVGLASVAKGAVEHASQRVS